MCMLVLWCRLLSPLILLLSMTLLSPLILMNYTHHWSPHWSDFKIKNSNRSTVSNWGFLNQFFSPCLLISISSCGLGLWCLTSLSIICIILVYLWDKLQQCLIFIQDFDRVPFIGIDIYSLWLLTITYIFHMHSIHISHKSDLRQSVVFYGSFGFPHCNISCV
jgi:hypothetical protein